MSVKVKWDDDNHVLYARKYLGKSKSGKVRLKRQSFHEAKNEAEAQVMADEWASHLTADGKVHSSRLTDLLDEYIALRERNGYSPNTIKGYRSYMRCYIVPAFDGELAADIDVHEFNDFEQALLTPKGEGGKGLSRNTVGAVHHFLSAAYKHFVKVGICGTNPLELVEKPRSEKHEAKFLSEYDLDACYAALYRTLADESLPWTDIAYAFTAWLSLATGMRCGEALAMRPCDLMRRSGYVHVGGTVIVERGKKPYRRDVTKGRKCRNVSLDDGEFDVIQAYLDARDKALGRFPGDSPLATVDGSYMRPSTVSGAFTRFAKKNGMPKGFTFHGLRHTHATWCLMNGIDLKTLSERLGHASEKTTIEIYGHVMPGRDQNAAKVAAMPSRKAREALQPTDNQPIAPKPRGEPETQAQAQRTALAGTPPEKQEGIVTTT